MANNVVDGINQEATKRLDTKKQTLDDAYAEPMNFLEIDVCDPVTRGINRTRYTDYEIRLRVSRLGEWFREKIHTQTRQFIKLHHRTLLF